MTIDPTYLGKATRTWIREVLRKPRNQAPIYPST